MSIKYAKIWQVRTEMNNKGRFKSPRENRDRGQPGRVDSSNNQRKDNYQEFSQYCDRTTKEC